MSPRRFRTPEEAMRAVTVDIILRAAKASRRKGRTIFIGKAARSKGVDVATLDPGTPEGQRRLDAFLTPVRRHYTFHGLGAPEEPNAINWRTLNLPAWRRVLVQLQVAISFLRKALRSRTSSFAGWGLTSGRTSRSCRWCGLITSVPS